ncbi:Peroxisome biogenesis protein 19-2 [Zancudomyces culisetae]|uniref:Peroxisome biogenesis protein 19-2 n=1 Tax=Zancudomyces culisetae TaxID=1213189 RepID=A0A1R1PU09_ZANCU|nr:Peroxisome biogenesis protein 19-2 [Zancudomyces culisetae]|eukprot:OMH84475.1 Peroxisome biogenesis protein 19-2 [Zancudomyces culisetae]
MDHNSDNDFDDLLDDALDEFERVEPQKSVSAVESKIADKKSEVAAEETKISGEEKPKEGTDFDLSELMNDEFAAQLAKEMNNLLDGEEFDGAEFADEFNTIIKGIADNPQTSAGQMNFAALEKQFASMLNIDPKELEEFNKSLSNPQDVQKQLAEKSRKPGDNASAEPKKKPANLQEKIQQTMDKINESDEMAKQKVSAGIGGFSGNPLDVLGQAGGFDEIMNDSEIEKLLSQVMSEMSVKDILYEPMKLLLEEYPKYFEKFDGKVDEKDMTRYHAQYSGIKKIVEIFDSPDYNTEASKKKVTELLELTQNNGEPPPEILEKVAPQLDMPEGSDSSHKPGQCPVM